MKTSAIIIHINPYSTKLTACPAIDATRDVRNRDQIEIQNYMKSLILLFLVDI